MKITASLSYLSAISTGSIILPIDLLIFCPSTVRYHVTNSLSGKRYHALINIAGRYVA
ncbi:MAG: hypothetical protein WCG25_04570 [bacterium]